MPLFSSPCPYAETMTTYDTATPDAKEYFVFHDQGQIAPLGLFDNFDQADEAAREIDHGTVWIMSRNEVETLRQSVDQSVALSRKLSELLPDQSIASITAQEPWFVFHDQGQVAFLGMFALRAIEQAHKAADVMYQGEFSWLMDAQALQALHESLEKIPHPLQAQSEQEQEPLHYYRITGAGGDDDEFTSLEYRARSADEAAGLFIRDMALGTYTDADELLLCMDTGNGIYIDAIHKSSAPIELCEQSESLHELLNRIQPEKWNWPQPESSHQTPKP